MNTKALIHCVDDTALNRNMLGKLLHEYDCKLIETGQGCLDAAKETAPDLILLDVNMPEMDGIETCQKLKAEDDLHDIPVIFLSAAVDLNTRLEGYAAGGDDYVAKPFEHEELIAKVKAALYRKEKMDKIHHEVKTSTSMTMGIMTAMGENSTVIHFLQSTFNCNSYEALAKRIIKAHESLGLNVAIEFILENEKQHYFTADVQQPLEESVFDFVREKGRLVDFGERTAVNFPNISIIIRNMPIQDRELHGRIRDHIALIAQGADSKISGLNTIFRIKQQHEDLIRIMNETTVVLSDIDQAYIDQKATSEEIISKLAGSIEDSFLQLGLSDQQEEVQRSIIKTTEEEIQELYKKGLALDDKFSTILAHMQEVLENNIIEDNNEDEDDNDMDEEAVSLF